MSYLERLMIRGIRSFGPGESDKAIIEFYTPLTLIAGQNGAGKTTIIECLRYATTGEVPPQGRGGAFVCDPKLVGATNVRACIKVKFKDVLGNEITCLRIVQSTQKQKKLEQKQLDGSMEKVNRATGEKCKLTTRCGEIDDEMVYHMGVSKAILNNVIFCHQEESNWPLSEGKLLKDRFDEIFASTRYSKALDAIKKFQTEQKSKIIQYTTEMNHLKQQKVKADELKSRVKETQRKLDAFKDDTTRVTNELKPLESRIRELDSMYEEVQKKERKLTELRSSQNELLKQQETFMEKIEEQISGSEEEVQAMYERHHHQLEKCQGALRECEDQLSALRNDESRLKTVITEQSKELGRLEVENKQYQQSITARNGRIASLAKELGLTDYDRELSNSSIRQFLSETVEYIEKNEEKGRAKKMEYEASETTLGKQITELRDSLSRLQEKEKMRKKQLDDNLKEIQVINRKLARVGGASSAFDQLDLGLKQAEKELEEYQESVDVSALERELEETGEQKRKTGETVTRLQQEQSIITQQSSARGALQNMQKDKQAKEQQYQKLFAELESEILSLVGSMPLEDEINSSIETFESNKKASLKKLQSTFTKLSSGISGRKAQLEEKTKQLKRKRDALEVLEEEVSSICGGSTFPDKKKQIEQEKSKLEEDLSTIKGSQAYFKQCLSKARTSKKCPLCARGYDTQEGLDSLVTSIERRMNSKVPELVKTYEKQLEQTEKIHMKLIQLKPKIDQMQELRNEEIPLLEKDVNMATAEVNTKKEELEKVEKQQTESQSQLERIRKLHPKTVQLSHLQQDLKKLDRSISTELSKLGSGAESVRSHAVVHRELQKAQMQAEELGRKMDNKRQEISSTEKSMRELEYKVHSLKKEKLELQEQVQQRQSLVSKKEELTTANEGLKRDIEGASHQLKPLRSKLKEVEEELNNVRKEREQFEEEHRSKIGSLKNQRDNVVSRNNEVKRYEARGTATALEECSLKMAELQKHVDAKSAEKKATESKIEKLRKQLANSKLRERELEDNLELIKIQAAVERKDSKIQKIEQELRTKGLDQYGSEYQRLQKDVEKLRKEKARLEGHCQGKNEELHHLKRDLRSDLYRDIDKRHKDVNVMLQTTSISNSDLEKYYKALDRAIMSFHSIKMEEINKIIKELWIKTYKGGDIDTIAIRSESATDRPDGISTKRTYNYRVVMVKGDAELDMRGRCSAGQKVLASIIIRLALAETFCLNCGVMVLDEPTTNLDSENVEGLAQSLVDIIRERSRQKNFQLILITHDMKFVEFIGRSGVVEKYSMVKKEIGSFSTVKKTPISDLAIYN